MLAELTPIEIRDLIATQKNVLLIDVREPGEYAVARIEGAKLIPMRTLPEQLVSLPRDGEIVLYCHHGMRSEMAGDFLVKQGFSRVAHMLGGIDRWSDDVDTSVAKY
jgi:rhodanese-related sulfurtransferase